MENQFHLHCIENTLSLHIARIEQSIIEQFVMVYPGGKTVQRRHRIKWVMFMESG